MDFRLPEALDRRSIQALWTLASAAAFDHRTSPWIDTLIAEGARFQNRVRVDLQHGVLESLARLETALRSGRAADGVNARDEALTIIYRILFLLFAESRDLVPTGHPIYRRAYAVGTLCREALAGDDTGLWDAMAAITRISRAGCHADDLIVRPFNGHLFARAAAPSLERRHRRGADRPGRPSPRASALSRTLVALGSRPGPGGRESVSYADLGVEELGAVYERVLGLERDVRKQTGTFYTPRPLAEFVVRRTLAPLVAGRTSDEILGLRVVDPAMGSGAFLVAAGRYLAEAYETACLDEGRTAPDEIDEDWRAAARRLVAERCLAGVDVNPVAVQLARLSLWLATLARGRPLGFLDHQLRVGNSLIGASPEDLHRALPRRRRRRSPLPLFDVDAIEGTMRSVAVPLRELWQHEDETLGDVRHKEALWRRLAGRNSPLEPWRLALSFWCARWFWQQGRHAGRPPSDAEVRAGLDAILGRDRWLPRTKLEPWVTTTRAVAARHRFFHWPLEFADVFYEPAGHPRGRPGFDAVIGNPPWEVLRGARRHGTGDASGARDLLRFVRDSGVYPCCDRGHLNLYQPFVERALSLTRPGGRVGLVLPWSLATDDGAASLRAALLNRTRLDVLIGMDNAGGLFPIHRGLRFMAVVGTRDGRTSELPARFGIRSVDELEALPVSDDGSGPPACSIRIERDVLERVGGAGLRIPDVRRPETLALLDRLFGDHPGLGADEGWAVRFGRELNATEDCASFGPDGFPVVEGKHLSPFLTHADRARRRIAPARAAHLLPDRGFDRSRLAYRDVSGVGNRRPLIAAILPAGVVTTHTVYCLRTPIPIEAQYFLCGVFNSYVINAVVRMLMGSHVTTSLVERLPVPAWTRSRDQRRIGHQARLLSRRPDEAIEAELHASVAQLYRVTPDELAALLAGLPTGEQGGGQRALALLAARRKA